MIDSHKEEKRGGRSGMGKALFDISVGVPEFLVTQL